MRSTCPLGAVVLLAAKQLAGERRLGLGRWIGVVTGHGTTGGTKTRSLHRNLRGVLATSPELLLVPQY